MGTKPKTRFGVIFEGAKRELFSVRELDNGDLSIFFKAPPFYDFLDGRSEKTLEHRYSFHRSLNSTPPAITLMRTVALEGGQIIRTSQLRWRAGESFSTMVFARACPTLRPEHYIMKERPKDTVILLYPIDIGRTTLFYHVVVTDTSLDPVIFRRSGLWVTSETFGHFKLVVLSGFFLILPFHRGFVSHAMTSKMRVDGQEIGADLPPIDLGNVSPERLLIDIGRMTTLLAEGLAERHISYIREQRYAERFVTETRQLLSLRPVPTPPDLPRR
ncbi:hypothetical protein [Mesorhizobium sp. IMUNJ 23232]|uniref:hypothetical protein n=1 Tax=Mesorhizobium sp. IMUNJ 23232 TaxID=3376064 RepID=UPI003792DB00